MMMALMMLEKKHLLCNIAIRLQDNDVTHCNGIMCKSCVCEIGKFMYIINSGTLLRFKTFFETMKENKTSI